MNTRLLIVLGSLMVALVSIGASVLALEEATIPTDKRSAELVEAMVQPQERYRVLVYLSDSADLAPRTFSADPTTRHRQLISRLQDVARQQDELRDQLAEVRPLWIVNAIALAADADTIDWLSTQPEVATIESDALISLLDEPLATVPVESAELAWGVEHIRAQHVWEGLGITGAGVTVAMMDTGANWLHVALRPSYRGAIGAHTGHWYDATSHASPLPVDPIGHGTHVMGTLAGQAGIGVAPDAKWITTRIFDDNGLTSTSIILAGFQWLLAPNGDPALAPDVVNNSWGGAGTNTAFWPAVQALHLAGIMTVFSTGNSGPMPTTVGAPASYTNTLSVGASDERDQLAWFSSRGPSLIADGIKPTLVAPGTAVVSAESNGNTIAMSGTSMASPHVAGTIALLLSHDPMLTYPQVQHILTSTVRPISTTHPNQNSGWGRLDAYSALTSQIDGFLLNGTITSDGVPLALAEIVVTTENGVELSFLTDGMGGFSAELQAGIYDVRVIQFGYYGQATTLELDADRIINFDLNARPTGTISGQIAAQADNTPISATILALGTPASTTTNSDGTYTLTLPTGFYQIKVDANGWRTETRAISVDEEGEVHNFTLESAPSIMLVDAGRWSYGSQLDYYRTALDQLGYAYAEFEVESPFAPKPDLTPYDVVIWSDPTYSPGSIGASTTISNYLGNGGNFLLSGQNVGQIDGQGLFTQWYWYRLLQAEYEGEIVPDAGVIGSAEFDALTLHFNGNGTAQNQLDIAQVQPRDGSYTYPIFEHPDGWAGGLAAGFCQPYRMAYFGFGLEGVSTQSDRNALLQTSIDLFTAPPNAIGVGFETPSIDDFAVAGEEYRYLLTFRNLSEIITDTFTITLTSSNWDANVVTQTVQLAPCERGQTEIVVTVPDTVGLGEENDVLVRVEGAQGDSAELLIHHHTPRSILFVDDDRWFDNEHVYLDALDTMGVPYDYWNIGWDNNVRGKVPLNVLLKYDIVLWYTGADWFRPLDGEEINSLYAYMQNGGRLFLTSQDYLYFHRYHPLTSDFFGVLSYTLDVTPTMAFGTDSAESPSNFGGAHLLDYGSYENFSDGIVPFATSNTVVWHDGGMAGGTATAGNDWRTVFWALPLEALPTTASDDALNQIVGWLSDLGDTTFTTAPCLPISNLQSPISTSNCHTFTLTLRNLAYAPTNTVTITNPLPTELQLIAGTLTGGATYDPLTQHISWSGDLSPAGEHTITYQAIASGSSENPLTIYYARHEMQIERTARVWVDSADLTPSDITIVPTGIRGENVTYHLRLLNAGSADEATAMLYFPDVVRPITPTLQASGGNVYFVDDQTIGWDGAIETNMPITVTVAVTTPVGARSMWLSAVAHIDDGREPFVRYQQHELLPRRWFFPVVGR